VGEPCASTQTIPTTKTPMVSRFLEGFQGIARDLLTGKDGKTHDLGRWGIAFGLAGVTALVYYQEHLPVPVHTTARDLAIAYGVLLGGGGLGLSLKSKTEPGGDQ